MDMQSFPVESVSWEEAVEFCRRLSELPEEKAKERTYRLPTEAEWEYACRAGTTSPFHFGKTLNGNEANCDGNNPYGTKEKGRYLERTCRVGSYAANAFGLYDMHGNVWEWCQDYYGSYKDLESKDPLGAQIVDGNTRVLRGGSWYDSPFRCRSAYRSWFAPGRRDYDFGCRVVLCLD